ncbi:peroxisome assembly protein 26 [Syngnathoides biaculeatus]|uniref:peroxisome assembly protein 26 n=1 Tax=Syngnathoides biaculeatus TaxID=300417 RepID=UPI002ADD6A5B|nr:peroxisome assembly protein 26 [Syngnathoides biaculeatus]XP_061663431.1 peroxisome assembly protein 26 [Syngnathoides biaculeatus]XP_061663432.1 peroxisome assembly protein 26 [Syngnathoides biaculeatus]
MNGAATDDDFTPVFNSPLSCTQTELLDLLEDATEQLMLLNDFHATFDSCGRGLEILAHAEAEDASGELKAGFCIVGIQALAELNQWPGVLGWVLQHYHHQEDIPAKIMQMCILLYSKVGEPAAMEEASRAWLRSPSNCRTDGYRTVAELYLLQVLVPLGHTDQARELLVGEAWRAAFTDEQRRTALDIIEEHERGENGPSADADCGLNTDNASTQDSLLHQLETLLRLSYRRLTSSFSGFFPFHKLFLAALIFYLLLVRLDPGLPSSFPWISKLHQLLRQMWNAAAAPHRPARKE